jgi:hypothetical protein
MATIPISFVGSSIVSGLSASTNPVFNKIQLHGDGIVDKLRIVDYAMDTSELDALNLYDVYTWNEHTLLYAEFSNNLKAGSLLTDATIESWTIVRFCCSMASPKVIAYELDGSESNLVDYTAIKPNSYYYRINPISSNSVVSDIQSNTIDVCYDYYAFLDETTGESYIFNGNIENSPIQSPPSVSTYLGFTQYPAKSQGQPSYDTASFTAMLGNVESGEYTGDTIALYENLRVFIANGNEKIMKDRKGNIRRVFTENLARTIDEKPSELPTTISFMWTEVGVV